MAVFSPFHLLGLITLAVLASAQKLAASDGKLSAPLSLFFYYGYMNEWWTNQGLTTIGGKACRDTKKVCSFDEFLTATTTGKGGYSGGLNVGDNTAASSVKRLAESLQQRGMKDPITWNAKELVIDAPDDKDVFEDHVNYVLNAFEADADKEGHQPNYHLKAMDALTMAAELHTTAASKAFAAVLKQRGVTENPQYVSLPLDDSTDFSSYRDAIDIINLVKVYGYERLQSPITFFRATRANTASIEWADYLAKFRPCRSYDGSSLLPPIKPHPPITWP